jgi:hypothetical protein
VIGLRKPGWMFPANDDGQESGLNDPGIETFKDHPLKSLARECLQNSSDAADNSGKPVEVHFQKLEIPSSEFPGCVEFKKILQSCASFSKSSKQTVQFFERALEVLTQEKLHILRISDFNTTGLVVGERDDRSSDWFKLTKSVGVSDKNAGKLGSFGIGKHAPFACSDLRTVFYGTKDKNGATAFQGVSKLVSHRRDRKIITQGTGYFGDTRGNRPLLDFRAVAQIFARSKIGADVYVMGFHPFDDWEAKIIKTVIESFFVAIHHSTLIVKIGKTTLNKTSLPDQIKKYYAEPDPTFFADAYYEVLTNDETEQFVEEDFEGMGKVTLRILEKKEFRKKVAMFRRSGMKIFDKGHFQTPLRFAGVFTVEGGPLDALLRTTEPPSHNAWEPERGSDPATSKRILKKINNWINDRVRDLGTTEDVAEVDAEGVSQYLPDDIEDGSRGTPQEVETINEEPVEVLEVRLRSTPPSSAPIREPEDKPKPEAEEDEDVSEGGPDGLTNETDGDGGGGGGGGAAGTKEKSGGASDKTDHGHKRVEIDKVRIYCTDPSTGQYRVLFEPTSDGVTHLRVYVIGEVGVESARVAAFSVDGGPQVSNVPEKGLIGPLSVPRGARAVINVWLNDPLHCALGVSAYAD